MSVGTLVSDAVQLERFALDSVEIGPDNLSDAERLIHRCNPPFLRELDGEWCEPYRNRYRRSFLHLGKKLLIYYEKAATEPHKMLGPADRLIGHNPYKDSLRATALTLHRQIGLQQATAYYEAYAALLRTELERSRASLSPLCFIPWLQNNTISYLPALKQFKRVTRV